MKKLFISLATFTAGFFLVNMTTYFVGNTNSDDSKYLNAEKTFPIDSRPPPSERRFVSQEIESVIAEVSEKIKDKNLSKTFENCFPNTLDTTGSNYPDTFVITGDIPALWLRDSANQGLIRRQTKCVIFDGYANAFNKNNEGYSSKSDKSTKIVDGKPEDAINSHLWERKFEIDSLGAFLKLSSAFFFETGTKSFVDDEWLQALQKVIDIIKTQQMGTFEEIETYKYTSYTFERKTTLPTETFFWNIGYPAKKCGLVRSAFRPSDDANFLPFNIPANAMISVYLQKIGKMLQILQKQTPLINDCLELTIYEHGIMHDPETNEKYFAYEVDGYSSKVFLDDANVPSLLSLPYLEFVEKSDPIYLETRKRILSEKTNPFYFKGKAGEGVGGPHAGNNMIWPMAIIMRALTSDNAEEKKFCLEMLLNTTNNTFMMHESFHKNDASVYTRKWFSWANTLFGELVLDLHQNNLEILNNGESSTETFTPFCGKEIFKQIVSENKLIDSYCGLPLLNNK